MSARKPFSLINSKQLSICLCLKWFNGHAESVKLSYCFSLNVWAANGNLLWFNMASEIFAAVLSVKWCQTKCQSYKVIKRSIIIVNVKFHNTYSHILYILICKYFIWCFLHYILYIYFLVVYLGKNMLNKITYIGCNLLNSKFSYWIRLG